MAAAEEEDNDDDDEEVPDLLVDFSGDLLGEMDPTPPLLLLLLPVFFDFEASSLSLLGETVRLFDVDLVDNVEGGTGAAAADPVSAPPVTAPPPVMDPSFFFRSASSNFKSSISSKKLLSKPDSSLLSASFWAKRSLTRINKLTSRSADAVAGADDDVVRMVDMFVASEEGG